MPVHVRVSGGWRRTHASVRVSGSWRNVPQIYVKVSGSWRSLYSYYWSTGGWGSCSASCGGGYQYRSAYCTRNDGTTVDDSVCSRLVGGKPSTSQSCNTQSCVSCKYSGPTTSEQAGSYPFVIPNTGVHTRYKGIMGRDNKYYYVNGQYIAMCSTTPCGNYSFGNLMNSVYRDVSSGEGGTTTQIRAYYYEICGAF